MGAKIAWLHSIIKCGNHGIGLYIYISMCIVVFTSSSLLSPIIDDFRLIETNVHNMASVKCLLSNCVIFHLPVFLSYWFNMTDHCWEDIFQKNTSFLSICSKTNNFATDTENKNKTRDEESCNSASLFHISHINQ